MTSSGAERSRLYRERQQKGICVVPVEISSDARAHMIREGWLSEDEAKDLKLTADAVCDLLDCYRRGTLRGVTRHA
jgi:hypothetical protein